MINYSDYDYIKIPIKNCISHETNERCGRSFVENTISFIGDPIFEKEIKNNNQKGKDNMEEILKIYEKNQKDKLEKEGCEKIDKILKESKLGKIAKKLQKEADKELEVIFEDYKKNGKKYINIEVDFCHDEEILLKKEEIYRNIDEKETNLRNKIEEVKAILNITETYKQKMEILFSYEIIDKNGKIKK